VGAVVAPAGSVTAKPGARATTGGGSGAGGSGVATAGGAAGPLPAAAQW